MTSKNFSVELRELEDGPRELEGEISTQWLDQLLEDTDIQHGSDTPGRLELILTKNGNEVLVQGQLDVTVSLPCARTLEPAVYRLKPSIFLLLSPEGGGDISKRGRSHSKGRKESRAKAKKGDGAWDGDEELTGEDAAKDTYSGEQIVLDPFLREFILLEVPMLPLKEDLRDVAFEANPPLPGAKIAEKLENGESEEDSLDPRLSPLRDLKARLEKKE